MRINRTGAVVRSLCSFAKRRFIGNPPRPIYYTGSAGSGRPSLRDSVAIDVVVFLLTAFKRGHVRKSKLPDGANFRYDGRRKGIHFERDVWSHMRGRQMFSSENSLSVLPRDRDRWF